MKNIPFTRRELFARGPQITYRARSLDEIAFPIGGIGAGMITLGGWGQLRDWEIRNHPDSRYVVPYAFFSICTRMGREAPLLRVLQGPVGGPLDSGHGVSYVVGAGLPHFEEARFTGEFPIARVDLRDSTMPVRVALEAFNPFIPLNDKDSSIPVAILVYRVKNVTRRTVHTTLFGNLTNVIGPDRAPGRANSVRRARGLRALYLHHEKLNPADPAFGSLALAALSEDAAVWRRWPRWRTSPFAKDGKGVLRVFSEAVLAGAPLPGSAGTDSDTGSVAVRFALKPGETAASPFLVAWHFPTYADPDKCGKSWRNYYAGQWRDAWDVVRYVARHFDRLSSDTRLFRDVFFSSTLPSNVLDAVSATAAVLKSPTCLRLEDGAFWAWEGSGDRTGCCSGSCSHVWNYAQTLAFLFPKLQRSMVESHLVHGLRRDGFMMFRITPPLDRCVPDASFHPAADGQLGLVMQVYRDWLLTADRDWLQANWPRCRKALEFAWKYWDRDRDGVAEGMQHNTYDIEFHGPNPLGQCMYLGALRAGEELARVMGDPRRADEYRRLFDKGSARFDRRLWNGEFYVQDVRPRARDAWPALLRKKSLAHGNDEKFPWPRFQMGKACLSDQLLGQWIARILDLGYLLPRRRVRRALRSVFEYNWQPTLREFYNPHRVYALGDEAGLLLASWPKGDRPASAFYYADEVWTGIEYQVAGHLIYEGMVDEGLAIVAGLRRRHRGDRRNPWSEPECGRYYARSMSSYALLTALSGFSYSAPDQSLSFAPALSQKNFRAFFCVPSAWGSFAQTIEKGKITLSLKIAHGELSIATLRAALRPPARARVSATLGSRRIAASLQPAPSGLSISFPDPLTIPPASPLRMTIL